jgi:endonuclease-3
MSRVSPTQSSRARSIIRALARTYPDARLELDFATPLELLVALILAAQFRDDRVNQITPPLFARFRTARDYAEAEAGELESYLREVNFNRKKTKAVQACARALVENFGGEVPRSLDDLLTLPWVGRKTANILRGNAFGEPAIGVDRHVMRVSQRIGLTREQDPDRIERDLVAVVPAADQVRFCHLLQLHGRRVCLARAPRCDACVIRRWCDFGSKAAASPRSVPRRATAQARGKRRASPPK